MDHIIDDCRTPGLIRYQSYPAWRTAALVCSAWVSRSQFNLLCDVHLTSSSHVDLLIRTLLSRPLLADLVRMLTVIGIDYIPFPRMPLAHLLKNCFALQFHSNWSRIPPRYANIGLYLWTDSAITQLTITWSPYAYRAILRYIWSLPSLQQLALGIYHASKEHNVTTSFPASGSPSGRCQALRRLRIFVRSHLYLDCVEPEPTIMTHLEFAPKDHHGGLEVAPGSFGVSFTQLELSLHDKLAGQ